jgi:hypothetical protein
MVNNNKTLLLLIISLVYLFASACATAETGDAELSTIEKEESMELFKGFIADNELKLSDLELPEYYIEELKSFFGVLFCNEAPICSYDNYCTLTISEVDKRFPVRCLRYNKGYYTIYKVREAGFYYVFWGKRFESNSYYSLDTSKPLEPQVYFAAYFSSLPTIENFKDLKEGVSSAEDVFHIDPAFELNFAISRGVFSYSLLRDGSILEIEYKYKRLNRRNDLIFMGKEVKKRERALSEFRFILSEDFQEIVK